MRRTEQSGTVDEVPISPRPAEMLGMSSRGAGGNDRMAFMTGALAGSRRDGPGRTRF